MKSFLSRKLLAVGLGFTATAIPLTVHAQADKAFSTNPTNNAFSGINWTVGTTPAETPDAAAESGDSLFFGTSPETALNNDLTNAIFGGFTFNLGASAFTFDGNGFALGNGAGIVNNSTALQIFNTDIALIDSHAFTTNTGGITAAGVLSGAGALNKTGSGTLTLSGANTYSGGTTTEGIVQANDSSALGTGAVTVNAGAGNQLQLADGVNLSNALTINGGGVVGQGIVHVAAGDATYSGPVNITAAADAGGHFASGGAASLTIAGDNTITTNGVDPVSIRAGRVIIDGAQNYTGGTALVTTNARALVQFSQTASMPDSGTVTIAEGNSLGINVGGVGEFAATGTGAGTINGILGGTGGTGAPVDLQTGSSLAIDTSNATENVVFNDAFTSANNVGLLKLGDGTLELNNGGTYNGAGAAAFPFAARQGTVIFGGGTHTIGGEFVVGGTYGTAAGAVGYDASVEVNSGALEGISWLSVGRGNGTGGVSSNLVLNNDATVTAQNVSAGFNAGSAANMPKGSITLNDTSSLTATGNTVWIGESDGSDMTMTINDDATFDAPAAFVGIGHNAGKGTVIVNGGTLNANVVSIGPGSNNQQAANGTLTVNAGGTVNTEGDLITGFAGNSSAQALLNLDGGTINVATTTKRWMIIAQWDATNSTINVNSGALNLNTNTDIRFSIGNNTGTNVFNLNGGGVTSFSDNGITANGAGVLDLMQNGSASSNNTFNLNGGVLAMRQVMSSQNSGTRTFNFNGGTFKATGDADLVALGTGNARANVRDGGAIIDTNGANASLSQSLLHSDLVGDAEIDGGFTKIGAGTLTLTGANTYTGGTFVEVGTLATGATGTFGTGNVTVADGAGLTVGNVDSMGEVFLFFEEGSNIALDYEGVITLAGITYTTDALSIGTGTFDAATLNTFFGGDTFSGTGSLGVIPEPSTYALILASFGLAFAAFRRRRSATQK